SSFLPPLPTLLLSQYRPPSSPFEALASARDHSPSVVRNESRAALQQWIEVTPVLEPSVSFSFFHLIRNKLILREQRRKRCLWWWWWWWIHDWRLLFGVGVECGSDGRLG